MVLRFFPLYAAVYAVLIVCLLGLVMGSFCHAWAWRLAHGEKISRGRSHCPQCGHVLGAGDLVPLFSWLWLRGRCRYCGAAIPKRYPMAEAVSGLVYLTVFLRFGFSLDTLRFWLAGSFLLMASFHDWETFEIPDRTHLFLCAAFLLRVLSDGFHGFVTGLLGAVSISVPLLLLVLLTERLWKRETMGGGDIKLFASVGLHFSPAEMLLLLIVASITGLIAFFAGRGRSAEKNTFHQPFPFGPAIAIAAWFTAIAGRPLIQWYLSLFQF